MARDDYQPSLKAALNAALEKVPSVPALPADVTVTVTSTLFGTDSWTLPRS